MEEELTHAQSGAEELMYLSGPSYHKHKNFTVAGLGLWYFIGTAFFSAVRIIILSQLSHSSLIIFSQFSHSSRPTPSYLTALSQLSTVLSQFSHSSLTVSMILLQFSHQSPWFPASQKNRVYAVAFDIHWYYYKKDRARVNMFIYTIRIPRIVHAMLGIAVSIPIMFITRDLIKDRYLILDMFVAVSGGYLIFDIFARYNEHMHVMEPHGTTFSWDSVKRCLKGQWKLLVHHLFLAFFIYPLILSFRNDQGDFILACILFTELSTPFTELQWIMEHTLIPFNVRYVVISMLAITTFLCCRLLIVPFIYEAYAIHMDLTMYDVLITLAPWYHITAVAFTVPQIVWFYQLIVKIYKYLFDQHTKKDK